MKPRSAGSSSPTFLPRVIRLKSAVLKRERPEKPTKNARNTSKAMLRSAQLTESVSEEKRDALDFEKRNFNKSMEKSDKTKNEMDEALATTEKAMHVASSCTMDKKWTWREKGANLRTPSASTFLLDVYWRKYEAAETDENAVEALMEFTKGLRFEHYGKRKAFRPWKPIHIYMQSCPQWSPLENAAKDEITTENEAEKVDETWKPLDNADANNEIRPKSKAEKVDEACPPWEPLQDVEDDEDKVEKISILSLADELLSRIFMNISPKSAIWLNLRCRRFRELNLLLGYNRFSSIDIDWKNGLSSVRGLRCGTTWHQFDLQPDPEGEETSDIIKRCAREMRIFKHAVADRVTVTVQDFARTPDQPPSWIVQKLCETIKYKKLVVCFDSEQDFTEEFYDAFIKNRQHLAIDAVTITWSARFNHDQEKARNLIKSLPYSRTYRIGWKVGNGRMPAHEFILNEVLLLHLILNSYEACIQMFGNYTTHDIMKMFETIDNAQHMNKKISFLVDKKVIDDLYRTNHPLWYKESVFCKYIANLSTNTYLTATLNTVIIEHTNPN